MSERNVWVVMAPVALVQQVVRAAAAVERRVLRYRTGRDRRPARTERFRQKHDLSLRQLAGYLPLRRTSSHLTARGDIVIMLSPFWVELRAIAPHRRGQRSSSGRPMYERDGQIQTAFLDHILGSRCIE